MILDRWNWASQLRNDYRIKLDAEAKVISLSPIDQLLKVKLQFLDYGDASGLEEWKAFMEGLTMLIPKNSLTLKDYKIILEHYKDPNKSLLEIQNQKVLVNAYEYLRPNDQIAKSSPSSQGPPVIKKSKPQYTGHDMTDAKLLEESYNDLPEHRKFYHLSAEAVKKTLDFRFEDRTYSQSLMALLTGRGGDIEDWQKKRDGFIDFYQKLPESLKNYRIQIMHPEMEREAILIIHDGEVIWDAVSQLYQKYKSKEH